jgi:hypothetical protein
VSNVEAEHGCREFVFGLDGDSKAHFFLIDIHLDAEILVGSIVPGVEVELEDVALLLLRRGHRKHTPHLEELLNVLLSNRVLVHYLEAHRSPKLFHTYDYSSCYQIP